MKSGIDNIVDSTAGETDNINIVERAFQNILDAAPFPKHVIYKCINIQTHDFYREEGSINKTVREVIKLMKSGIDKIGTAIDMVEAFQIVLKVALPPMYTTH